MAFVFLQRKESDLIPNLDSKKSVKKTLPSIYSNVKDSNFDDAEGNMKLVYLAFCRGEGGSSQVPIIGVSCLQYKKTFSSQQHLLINQLGVSVILNNLIMGFAMILASFSDNLIRRYKQRDFEWSVCKKF